MTQAYLPDASGSSADDVEPLQTNVVAGSEENVTVPEGVVPTDDVTVAVKVIGAPGATEVADATREVDVGEAGGDGGGVETGTAR